MSVASFTGLQHLFYRDRLARLRAYKRLLFAQGEKEIFEFINHLTASTYQLPDNFFENVLPARYSAWAVLCFRQKLLRTTLDNDLAPGVMLMIGGSHSVFPARLPGQWRRALADRGLRVHKLSSLFWCYVVLQKLKEAFTFYRRVAHMGAGVTTPAPYALLMGLPSRAYAGLSQGDEGVYNNFSAWFGQRHPELDLKIVTGAVQDHRLKPHIQYLNDMWRPLKDEHAYKEFRQQACKVLWHSLTALVRGRWQYMFMARDILELHYTTLIEANQLPRRVAITNSHYIVRPLWSYNLEDRGIETGLYFYSTNTFNIKLRDGDYGQIYGYDLMSWSHYYVATPEQANFLNEVNALPKEIHVVGPIPLEDNGAALPEKSGPTVAYFDVQPFREAFMARIGRPTPLYFYEASRRNLEDILAVCKEHGFSLVLKPKRDVGNRLCPHYKKMIAQLEAQGDIKIIDSYIAAERVAAWADVVISQPFTSVALVAQNLGKPSVYYDALCIYQKEQPAAQGQQVIQDRESLSCWLGNISRVTAGH